MTISSATDPVLGPGLGPKHPDWPLVSTAWTEAHLGGVKLIDASWRLPAAAAQSGHASDAYAAAHVPGAVFFDIDQIADRSSSLPHMAPSDAEFAASVGALGISRDDHVVVYDDAGIFSAARVWWTFLAFGHERVAVMDGGFPKWLREGKPTQTDIDSNAVRPQPTPYTLSPRQRQHIADIETVRQAIARQDRVILDARPAARFNGASPEPRAGLRTGAMPGAKNIPYTELLNDDGTLKNDQALVDIFDRLGADTGQSMIATCGSGVTAAIIILALEKIGRRQHALYDGAWAQWGDPSHGALCPVVTATPPSE